MVHLSEPVGGEGAIKSHSSGSVKKIVIGG